MAEHPNLALDLARGFAEQVRQWSLEAGARPEDAAVAARAAQALSLATSAGHVCLPLDELRALAGPDAPEALRAARVAGTPQAPGTLPLVLDGERLYLHRYFDYERRLARRLLQVRPPGAAVSARARALLRELFPARDATPGGGPDGRRLAAALALHRGLVLVSGGPGTGKTTLVARLLAVLLAQAPQARIALAAPTGKAAARLAQALRAQADALPADLRARLPTQASTVHRLLGGHAAAGFTHDAARRLPLDVLVVDEASMLDLALATRLLEAVPDSARIVLLGDKDQLAAVEAGAVFAELTTDPSLSPGCARELAALCGEAPAALASLVPSGAAPPRPGGLRDAVVWLRGSWRFGPTSALGRLAAAVNAGDAATALALLRASDNGADTHANPCPLPGTGLCWHPDTHAALGPATRQRLLAGFGAYVEALRRDPRDAAAVTAAWARFRVLAALRQGGRGAAALDALVAAHVRRAVGADTRVPWYPGRAVLVTRNDPALGLFNGDVGIALPDAQGTLRVMFSDGSGGLRAVAPAQLPLCQGAFALTVHRAQGSEFDAVMLVLPERGSRVLSRELLYTGLTRARACATLVGSAAMVEAAVRSPTRRHSGLPARLQEEATAAQPAGPGRCANAPNETSGAP